MTVVRIVDDAASIEQCFAIRRRVFVEEQDVAEDLEWDGLDDDCAQFLALPSKDAPLAAATGTARLWVTPDGVAKAQRVAVLKSARGQRVGHALMDALEAEAARRGHAEVVLGAQVTALGFYESRGYEAYGAIFDDAGIPHRMMRKAVTDSPVGGT